MNDLSRNLSIIFLSLYRLKKYVGSRCAPQGAYFAVAASVGTSILVIVTWLQQLNCTNTGNDLIDLHFRMI